MMTRIEKRFERILIAAVLLEFLALVAISLFAIPVHISRNFNEGWNAYFAQAALGHGVLYPAADSMLTNNYPPLSFYIVGAAGWLVGDNIVAGRVIAVLALGVIAFNMFRIGQWLGAERRLALLGVGVFLLGVYTMMPGYIGIDDPQFLAYALVTSGGVIFLQTTGPRWWRGMLLSSLLMVLGGLVKHSGISLPLALCTWALFYDRRRLGFFVVCALVIGTLACALAYALWGRPMVDSVLFGIKLIDFGRGWARILQDLPFLVPYLTLGILALLLAKERCQQAAFVLFYLAWSLINGFWMLSAFGVNQNVMCDAVIALALASVLFVTAVRNSSTYAVMFAGHGRTFAMLLMILPCAVSGLTVYLDRPSLRDIGDIKNGAKWEQLYRGLSLAHGDVACETLAVCYWAKKPMQVDFFNYGQKIFVGSVDVRAPDSFLSRVSRKSYAYVVIETAAFPRNRLPPLLIDALFENYAPVAEIKGVELVLAPRP